MEARTAGMAVLVNITALLLRDWNRPSVQPHHTWLRTEMKSAGWERISVVVISVQVSRLLLPC